MKRFFVDAMLGKIAIWLRLTGHDTIYNPDIHDDEILDIAKAENRIILTSDEELVERAERRDIGAYLVRGDVDSRVAGVFRQFDISTDVNPDVSRCTKCNGILTKINSSEKKKVRSLVKKGTYENHDVFWLCTDCDSIFWEGSHWKNMMKYMKRINNLIRSEH